MRRPWKDKISVRIIRVCMETTLAMNRKPADSMRWSSVSIRMHISDKNWQCLDILPLLIWFRDLIKQIFLLRNSIDADITLCYIRASQQDHRETFLVLTVTLEREFMIFCHIADWTKQLVNCKLKFIVVIPWILLSLKNHISIRQELIICCLICDKIMSAFLRKWCNTKCLLKFKKLKIVNGYSIPVNFCSYFSILSLEFTAGIERHPASEDMEVYQRRQLPIPSEQHGGGHEKGLWRTLSLHRIGDSSALQLWSWLSFVHAAHVLLSR